MQTKTRPLTVPDLIPFDRSRAITLREAVDGGHVSPPPGKRLNAEQLGRWSRKGVRLVRGGPLYRFPTFPGPKELLTTLDWCRAWEGFCARVQAATR